MKIRIDEPFFPVREEKLQTVEGRKLVSRKAIINDETDEIISVVSDQYCVVDNSTVVKSFEQFLEDSKVEFQQMDSYCDSSGKKFYAKYRFPEISRNFGMHKTQFGEIPDDVQMSMEITNSYDGSHKFGFSIMGYRLVCLNGLRVDEKIYSFAAKHVSSQIEEAANLIMINFETAKEIFMNIADSFASMKTTDFEKVRAAKIVRTMELSKMYAKKFGILYKQEIDNLKTMWDFYNLITWMTSHVIENRNKALANKVAAAAATAIIGNGNE